MFTTLKDRVAGAMLTILIGVCLGVPVGAVAALNGAEQSGIITRSAPYGGCKEAWQAPRSEGAKWCRSRGWTVHRRIVVDPRDYVRFYRLPSCLTVKAPCQYGFDFPAEAWEEDGFAGYWVGRNLIVHVVAGVKC